MIKELVEKVSYTEKDSPIVSKEEISNALKTTNQVLSFNIINEIMKFLPFDQSYNNVLCCKNKNVAKGFLENLVNQKLDIGLIIASAGRDMKIKFWDTTTNPPKLIKKIDDAHADSVSHIVKLNERYLASSSWDTTVKIWDYVDGKCVKTLEGHKYSVDALIKLSETEIASGSRDKTCKIWNFKTGECLKTLEEHPGPICTILKFNNKEILTGAWDDLIKCWDIISGKCLRTYTGHTDSVTCLCKINETQFASGGWDDVINIWDYETAEIKMTLKGAKDNIRQLLLITPNILVSGLYNGNMIWWDLKEGKEIDTKTDHKDSTPWITKMNEKEFVSASCDNSIKIWNSHEKTVKATIENAHDNYIYSVIKIK